jgi:hypothetical protein
MPDHLISLKVPASGEISRAPTTKIRAATYEANAGAGSVDVTAKVASIVASGR